MKLNCSHILCCLFVQHLCTCCSIRKLSSTIPFKSLGTHTALLSLLLNSSMHIAHVLVLLAFACCIHTARARQQSISAQVPMHYTAAASVDVTSANCSLLIEPATVKYSSWAAVSDRCAGLPPTLLVGKCQLWFYVDITFSDAHHVLSKFSLRPQHH